MKPLLFRVGQLITHSYLMNKITVVTKSGRIKARMCNQSLCEG